MMHVGEWYYVHDVEEDSGEVSVDGGDGPIYMVFCTEAHDWGFIAYEWIGHSLGTEWGPLGLMPLEFQREGDPALIIPLEVH